MSIQDVAELTGLSWDTVKGIHKTHLRRKYKSFNLKKVRHIAIDEVYLGKKRKYNCKIGILQRNAYGYRDEEYLKLRIFNLHNSTYALTG